MRLIGVADQFIFCATQSPTASKSAILAIRSFERKRFKLGVRTVFLSSDLLLPRLKLSRSFTTNSERGTPGVSGFGIAA